VRLVEQTKKREPVSGETHCGYGRVARDSAMEFGLSAGTKKNPNSKLLGLNEYGTYLLSHMVV
jgi:hypothetical protein